MAAIKSALQLEVAELIQDRAADGSLPAPVTTNEASLELNAATNAAAAIDAAAADAAAVVPSTSKRKAVDRDGVQVEEAEGSQMRKSKRPRVVQGQGEQPLEAQEGQAGASALNRGKASSADPPTAATRVDSHPKQPTVCLALPDQAVGTGPLPASLDTAGNTHTETAAMAGGSGHLGSSSAATLAQLGQSHGRSSGRAGSGANLMADQSQVGDLQESETAQAWDGAAGLTVDAAQEQARSAAAGTQHARDQPQASSAVPNEETLQRAQAGPSTQARVGPSIQTQAGPSNESPAGSSTGVPDQDMQEDANPEMKEKREQARNRSRAWRKVLLDGLDLQTELTAAAAKVLHPDSALAEAEVKVGLVAGTI